MNKDQIKTKLLTQSSNCHELNEYLNLVVRDYKQTGRNLEAHHILPVALFPEYSNFKEFPWNKCRLSPKDHFLAHFLLHKMIGGKMSIAFNMMSNFKAKYSLTEDMLEEYELARKYQISIVSAIAKETMTKLNSCHEFRSKSNEAKRTHSYKQMCSLREKEKVKTGTHPFMTEEARKNSSKRLSERMTHSNHMKSEEQRLKLSERNKKNNPMANPETLEKMRQSKLNKPEVTCPHCGKNGKGSNMKRYHFDNCSSASWSI